MDGLSGLPLPAFYDVPWGFAIGKGDDTMTKLNELADLGQAVWLDYVRRSFIHSGDLQELVDAGLRERVGDTR